MTAVCAVADPAWRYLGLIFVYYLFIETGFLSVAPELATEIGLISEWGIKGMNSHACLFFFLNFIVIGCHVTQTGLRFVR